jgi:CTP synthase (UTP-ammonia lyase)
MAGIGISGHMTPVRIGLIGDRDPAVTAHRAIPLALELAGAAIGAEVAVTWFGTDAIAGRIPQSLGGCDGIWCVPASPYRSEAGALSAIRYARETGRPFLGTCGGFQHALLEYARNVLGIRAASHAETDPDAGEQVITPLACELVEQRGTVIFEPGSRFLALHGAREITEGYHCRYGLSAAYQAKLADSSLRIVARDAAGEVRAMELRGHPFFCLTLYQPERAALTGRAHPLVNAFVAAARAGMPVSA